jgi:hypothetical protein
LKEVDAQFGDDAEVGIRLHALSHDPGAELRRQSGDGFHDCAPIVIALRAGDEEAIDLEIVRAGLQHHAVVGEPDADVVEGNFNAEGAQPVQGSGKTPLVPCRGVLHDLDDQTRCFDAALKSRGLQHIDE